MKPAELTAWATRSAEAFRVTDGIGTVPDRDAAIIEGVVRCLADPHIPDDGVAAFISRGRGATTDPASGKPTYGDPRFNERTVYDAVCTEPDSVDPEAASWDLGFGACLSYGPEEDGTLIVTLNISDYTKATGSLTRTVTREQLVAHAEHLLRIAGAA